MTDTPSASDATSSQSTSYVNPDAEIYGMIENSIRNEGYVLENGVPVVRNTGELLANIHIVLVKRFLKLLKKKEKFTGSLVVYGLLLVRSQGALLCSMKIPVVNVPCDYSPQSATMAEGSTLSITTESSLGGLTHDIVCSAITHLIMNFDEA